MPETERKHTHYRHSYLPFVDQGTLARVGYRSILPDPKSLRVLIIEDEEDVAKAETFILEESGLERALGFTGLQIWSLARVTRNYRNLVRTLSATRPHVVIMDIIRHGRDGFETTHFLQTQVRPRIPTLIVSAKAEKTDVDKGLEIGALDFIVKPFDPGEFIQRLQGLLQKIGHDSLQAMWP